MKGAGGVAPESDKAGGESALRARLGASEQREAVLGVKVVSLEKVVAKLTEENTGLKEDNAVLSAYVDVHPDVEDGACDDDVVYRNVTTPTSDGSIGSTCATTPRSLQNENEFPRDSRDCEAGTPRPGILCMETSM